MNKIVINNRRYRVKPRFYVICLVLMGILLTNVAHVISTVNEPIIFARPMPPSSFTMKTPRYGFTDKDIHVLAQLLCGDKTRDGDGEYDIDFFHEVDYYEVGKVLNVVMNRVRSEIFPNLVYDVVTQYNQFSVMPKNLQAEPSEKALRIVEEWCAAYDNYISVIQIIPTDHLYFGGDGYRNTTRATYQ